MKASEDLEQTPWRRPQMVDIHGSTQDPNRDSGSGLFVFLGVLLQSFEAMAAIDCFNADAPAPYTPIQVAHAIHNESGVFDVFWHHLDHGLFAITKLSVLADAVGKESLERFTEPEERRQFMTHHGYGEFYFLSAWSLYRGGKLDTAAEAAMHCLQHLPGFAPASKLLALIGLEKEEPGEIPFNHSTLSKLSFDDNFRVCWPEEASEFSAAAIHLEVERGWTAS